MSFRNISFPDFDLPKDSFVRLMLILPAIAYATTKEERQESLLSLGELCLQVLFPDKTEQTVKLFFLTSLDTHSSKGPELPIHVVHP